MTPTDIQSGTPQVATITYEQPLSERLRTYLRLEFLYRQMAFNQQNADAWSTRSAMNAILDILAITARGDCRTDALKEIERQLVLLNEYRHHTAVDTERLDTILQKLAHHRSELNSVPGAFMQNLRDSEFLNAIRHRSAIPGGTCEFDLRDYYYWLNQTFATRQADLDLWTKDIRILCEAITCLLWVIREQAKTRRETAISGQFQLNLDKDNHCQLIRVTLPSGSDLYPEISGTHYRCIVRFLKWQGVASRPIQAEADIPFLLTTCS